MIKKVTNYIKRVVLAWRMKKAIKRANAWHELTKATYVVCMVKRKPKVFSKQDLKRLHRQKKFKVPFQELLNNVIYSTNGVDRLNKG